MNTTLDSLTESIVENGKTILAATLIVKGPADRPHRVVMRYWRGEFERKKRGRLNKSEPATSIQASPKRF